MTDPSIHRPSDDDLTRAINEASGLRRENTRLEKKAKGMSRLVIVLALALVASAVYGYNGYTNPDLGVSDEVIDRWARGAVYDLIQDVEFFRTQNGRLPRDLAEVGIDESLSIGFTYTTNGSGGYSVSVESRNGPVGYTSGDDLAPFEEAAGVRAFSPSPPATPASDPADQEPAA